MTTTALLPDPTTAVEAAIGTVAAWTPEQRRAEADRAADTIAYGADALHEADNGHIHDALITGLAILAHRPGGATFGGLHWHAREHPGCPGPGRWAPPADTAGRAARGAFYTPRDLADGLVRNTVGPLLGTTGPDRGVADLRIADIACGSGAFILAAARALAAALDAAWDDDDRDRAASEHGVDDPAAAARVVAVERLYGVDVDPVAVALTGVVLQLFAGEDVRPALRVGDALVGRTHPDWDDPGVAFPPGARRLDWPAVFPEVFAGPSEATCGFDAVIGNPPWLGGKKLSGAFGGGYREHLVDAVAHGRRGSADLAVYFWLRAHELVSELGVVGMILPTNVNRGGNLRVWREHLEMRCHRTVYREEPPRLWPGTSATVAYRVLCTVQRRWIDPEFRMSAEPAC